MFFLLVIYCKAWRVWGFLAKKKVDPRVLSEKLNPLALVPGSMRGKDQSWCFTTGLSPKLSVEPWGSSALPHHGGAIFSGPVSTTAAHGEVPSSSHRPTAAQDGGKASTAVGSSPVAQSHRIID